MWRAVTVAAANPADPDPEPLLAAPLVVTGHLVTFDEARPEIPDGALYVDRGGRIVAVSQATDPPPPGFEQANRVETGAVVYPGLIDLHNHIAYNCLSLWIAPDRTARGPPATSGRRTPTTCRRSRSR